MCDPESTSTWLGPPFRGPARRVVSLVPSLTHAVFELGAGSLLVGRTRYCVRPADGVAAVEAVGGTKDPDVGRVLTLEPDLVLANREENTRRRVERIAERAPVLLTDPRSPREVPALWRELGAVCGRLEAGERLAAEVEAELARALGTEALRAARFVYWVWRDPWMAAGHDTYISQLLETVGFRNAVPADRGRYPKVDPVEVASFRVEVMLFPSEPYDFELPRDLEPFRGAPTLEAGRWRLAGGITAVGADGQLFSWYPSLTAEGLRYARALRGRSG
jgi:ABC-type Fe3+-hydroxamate transport system substrate-binding protein